MVIQILVTLGLVILISVSVLVIADASRIVLQRWAVSLIEVMARWNMMLLDKQQRECELEIGVEVYQAKLLDRTGK